MGTNLAISGTTLNATDTNTTYGANQVLDWTADQGGTNIHYLEKISFYFNFFKFIFKF